MLWGVKEDDEKESEALSFAHWRLRLSHLELAERARLGDLDVPLPARTRVTEQDVERHLESLAKQQVEEERKRKRKLNLLFFLFFLLLLLGSFRRSGRAARHFLA